ncbi:glycosyltransferase [Candidatus Parcubacteria bacterium]|nr:glycosyltransferase [Candidatus Parcubacteria bacterium]
MTTSVLQALATGLPAITSDHGAFSEQIVDGKNGFLFPEGDYKALADKIIYYMDHPELWGSFGSFGRKLVEENFNFKELMDKQVDLYLALFDR